jgi:hypothetical protein
MEATRRDGLRARTCQAEVKNKRKESQRNPLLPDLRVADVINRVWFHFNSLSIKRLWKYLCLFHGELFVLNIIVLILQVLLTVILLWQYL